MDDNLLHTQLYILITKHNVVSRRRFELGELTDHIPIGPRNYGHKQYLPLQQIPLIIKHFCPRWHNLILLRVLHRHRMEAVLTQVASSSNFAPCVRATTTGMSFAIQHKPFIDSLDQWNPIYVSPRHTIPSSPLAPDRSCDCLVPLSLNPMYTNSIRPRMIACTRN